jgi:hypothetical protein
VKRLIWLLWNDPTDGKFLFWGMRYTVVMFLVVIPAEIVWLSLR